MSKPLSEMLEEIEPIKQSPVLGFVDSVTYNKLKKVAIELAKALELLDMQDRKKGYPTGAEWYHTVDNANRSLSRAKDIIGETK